MNDTDLLNDFLKAKEAFGTKCSKYLGSLCVELVRKALAEEGIEVSRRDCFIRGIPVEIDLLIPRQGAVAQHGILYEAKDVLIVLEIKAHGAYGKEAVSSIRKNFIAIQEKHKSIQCFYVTLMERKGYKWSITEERLGLPAYTLFFYTGNQEDCKSTGDWQRILSEINTRMKDVG